MFAIYSEEFSSHYVQDWQLFPIWAKYLVSLLSDFRIWFMYILETNVNVKGQKKVEKKSGSRKWGGRGPDSRFLQIHFIFWTNTIYILNKYIYNFNRYNGQFQQIQTGLQLLILTKTASMWTLTKKKSKTI